MGVQQKLFLFRSGITWWKLPAAVGIMAGSTLVALFFRHVGLLEANIIMVFILGVLLSSLSTGRLLGIASSVAGVLLFNFFFTEPRFTLVAHDDQYLITFPIMLIVAIITSELTSRIKQQAEQSEAREKRTNVAYQTSRALLKTRGTSNVINTGMENITKILNRNAIFYLVESDKKLSIPFISSGNRNNDTTYLTEGNEKAAAAWVLSNQRKAGAGTEIFLKAHVTYLPVNSKDGIIGVIGVSCKEGLLEQEEHSFLEAIAAQISLALDRERLAEEQEKSVMEMEREKLRSNLLRAISHDIRTPLAGIAGSAGTLLGEGNLISKEVKKELIKGIYDDAEWLNRLVENLLSITKIESGEVQVEKNWEAVEEIVSETLQRVQKRMENYSIKLNIPDDLILVPMDGNMIEQVLVNLIDNAVKYTPEGSLIELQIFKEKDRLVFKVMDNGPGIPEKDIKKVFDKFFTIKSVGVDSRRGVGLGLTICKSIIDAHGGVIEASNRPGCGTIFSFTLPLSDEKNTESENNTGEIDNGE